MKEKLLLMAASLLGFATACDQEKRMVDMYGTPYNNYKVKGKVTDKAGLPIPGIKVHNGSTLQKVETTSDGTFDIAGEGFSNRARIFFTDIDGPANGGDFAEKSVEIEFTEAERTAPESGSWHEGDFARTGVEVTLEEKE